MRGQGIEVVVQPVATQDGQAAARQPPVQLVSHHMGGVLRPRAEMEHRDDLPQLLDRQPEPQRVGPTAQPRPQFVELDVGEVKVAEEAVMQGRAVSAGPCQPSRDGGMPMPKHPHGG
jgi:hypothetical protein